MKPTENEQAYMISKVDDYMKSRTPDIIKSDMRYWFINEGKMIRNFEMLEKRFVQIIPQDEDGKTILSYSETDTAFLRFFKTDLTCEHLDRLLLV